MPPKKFKKKFENPAEIDLNPVVSKYIGETEKNLGRVMKPRESRGTALIFEEERDLFKKSAGQKKIRIPKISVNGEPSFPPAVRGIDTTITAFLGSAGKGPAFKAVSLTSFLEFEQVFGSLQPDSELGYAAYQFFLNGGRNAVIVRTPKKADSKQILKGMTAFDKTDLINLLLLPGISDAKILSKAVEYCGKRRTFLIADPPQDLSIQNLSAWINSSVFPKTSSAALYYPWIQIADPLQGGKARLAPPSGSVAGLFVQFDINQGVWKSPAGKGSLKNVLGPAASVTAEEVGLLNPMGVNCLRNFPGTGVSVWGARTLDPQKNAAGGFQYVSVKRLALYIEESLVRGLTWAVFEPNDEPLWVRLRLSTENFLMNLWRGGAFQGSKPEQAYFVKCDRSTMTQSDIQQGRVRMIVGFAALKPAEFILLRILLRSA